MRKLTILGLFLLSACSGGQIKELTQRSDALGKKVVEKQQEIDGLAARKTDLEGQLSDLDAKLKSAQARIDELDKSNKDLADSMKSGQGELSSKIAKLVTEKDELSRKLNELQKDKISADRAKATLAARREKLTAELAAARQELDDLHAADKKKQDERSGRLAKAHDEMGALADAILKPMQRDQASIAQDGETIVVTLQETVLFDARGAKLTDDGSAVLDKLGTALHGLSGRPVRVQGHSDNAPVKSELFGRFTGHWDLSSARATAVARYFHEHSGLDPRFLAAEGYGEFRPAKTNDSPEGRAANRRIVVLVEPPR